MKRIIIDSTLCDGCMKCTEACKKHFGDEKSRIFIQQNIKGRFVPLVCRQCPRPSCMQGCMSGVITRSKVTGHLQYDKDVCGKCYMCVMNCPYGIPFPTQEGYVARCDFCENENEGPLCVNACEKYAIYLEKE